MWTANIISFSRRICFISLLWTYLCILQFLYSSSSNSEYNKLFVLCSYLISFMDFICYLFSVLSIFLFPYISISILDLSCRYLSLNIELVFPQSSFSKSYSENNSDPTSDLHSEILGQEPERGTAHKLKSKSLLTSSRSRLDVQNSWSYLQYFPTLNTTSMYFSDLQAKCIPVKLPLPGAFNQWLSGNYFTCLKDHLPDAQFQWGDIVSNEVLCTVQMSIITVSVHIQYTI